MAHIARLEQLKVLNLPDAQFTDASLEALTDLANLELLRFGSPHVTDAGMVHVARIPSLRFLHLIDVPIGDRGLESLESLTQLESLYLDDTAATDAGITRLLKALPQIHLHVNQRHHDADPAARNHAH